MASVLSKKYPGKMKRAGLCSFVPDEFIIILDSARAQIVLLFEGDHAVPMYTELDKDLGQSWTQIS